MCEGRDKEFVSEEFAQTKVNTDAACSFLMNVVYVSCNVLAKFTHDLRVLASP